MIVNTGKKQYEIIQDVYLGSTNDVYVCREVNNPNKEYKTLWMIKDRNTAKKILQEFDMCKQSKNSIYSDCFAVRDNLCFTFPYSQERPLRKFYVSTLQKDICSRQQIWMELITKCMTSTLPDAVLKMLFQQNQIELSEDGSIYFNYALDLSQYSDTDDKIPSVILCAREIINLIQLEDSYQDREILRLIEHKLQRNEYLQYIELYKDMKILTNPRDKENRREAIRNWCSSKKDTFFHILSGIAIAMVIIILFLLIMRLIFGDFALFRLFSGPIVQIGTESLLQ